MVWSALCNPGTITASACTFGQQLEKDIAIFWYTDPSPEAQGCTYFPIRLGYASTIYKMQGAELDHVTIYLDRMGQKAAAYVAMSRAKSGNCYLFGGRYRRKHVVPNA